MLSITIALSTSAFMLMTINLPLTQQIFLTAMENPDSVVNRVLFSNVPVSQPFTDANLPIGYFQICQFTRSPVFQLMTQHQSSVIDRPGMDDVMHDLVKSFASHFIQNIQSDPKLRNAFAIQRLTADEAGNFYYDIVFEAHSRVKGPDPEFFAQLFAEAMKFNFEKMTTDTLLKSYAISVGKYLFLLRLLTNENVVEYSKKYFEKMRDGINSVGSLSPFDDIKGIAKGFMDFLTSMNLYRQDTAVFVASIFAKVWCNLKK